MALFHTLDNLEKRAALINVALFSVHLPTLTSIARAAMEKDACFSQAAPIATLIQIVVHQRHSVHKLSHHHLNKLFKYAVPVQLQEKYATPRLTLIHLKAPLSVVKVLTV
jgi:hypothetical protein